MFQKYIVFLHILFFIANSSVGQTCIVIVKQKDQIVVGSDSRARANNFKIINGRKIITDSIITTCKIRHRNKIYYSISGMADESLYTAVGNVCKNSKSLDLAAQNCSTQIVKYFDTLLENIRLTDPQFFKSNFPSPLVCKVAFYGWELNRPIAIFDVFRLASKLDEYVKVVCDYYPDQPLNVNQDYLRYVLGRDNAIKKIPHSEEVSLLINKDLKQPIIHLINLEIQDDSLEVGPPINIIKIDKDGRHWLTNKGKCSL